MDRRVKGDDIAVLRAYFDLKEEFKDKPNKCPVGQETGDEFMERAIATMGHLI